MGRHEQAKNFINALFAPEEEVKLRFFNDRSKNLPGGKITFPASSFDEQIPYLEQQNELFYCISLSVNGGDTDGSTVAKGKARAQFMECDELSLEEQREQIDSFELEPSAIIQTRKSLHTYWFLKDGDILRFREIQLRFAKRFHGDAAVANESRVMRLPSFNHCKGEPVECQLILFNPELRYTQDELCEYLPELTPDEMENCLSGLRKAVEKANELLPEDEQITLPAPGPLSPRYTERQFNQPGLADVMRNCDFLDYCESQAADLPEPLWLAMISNLAFFEGGTDAIHRLSSPYPGYTFSETAEKINRFIQSGAGPVKCQTIKTWGFSCPKMENGLCSCKSPAALAYKIAKEDGDLLDTLRRLHPERNARYPWTDLGNSNLFSDVVKPYLRYVPERKSWFHYDGCIWSPDKGDVRAMQNLKTLARALNMYAASLQGENGDKYLKFIHTWQKFTTRQQILKDAQTVHPIRMEQFDTRPLVLNVRNVTLDLESDSISRHSPEDFLTQVAGVEYMPGARCRRWEQFVDEITCGDAELAEYLQKMAGYCLTGETGLECLFMMLGISTRNGKTTFAETLRVMLGSYALEVSPETIAQQSRTNSHGPSEDIARLKGCRLAVVSEPDKGLMLSEAKVKQLTGGGSVNARFLNENSFDFVPQFKLLIDTNYRPGVTDLSIFSSDRIRVIPFQRHFEPEERDVTLKQQLQEPDALSGVLNWAMDGLKMLRQSGLQTPDAVRIAVADYEYSSDKVRQFLDETCEPETDGEIKPKDLFRLFESWCEGNGLRSGGIQKFGQELERVGTVKRKRPNDGGGATTLFMGYRIRPPYRWVLGE